MKTSKTLSATIASIEDMLFADKIMTIETEISKATDRGFFGVVRELRNLLENVRDDADLVGIVRNSADVPSGVDADDCPRLGYGRTGLTYAEKLSSKPADWKPRAGWHVATHDELTHRIQEIAAKNAEIALKEKREADRYNSLINDCSSVDDLIEEKLCGKVILTDGKYWRCILPASPAKICDIDGGEFAGFHIAAIPTDGRWVGANSIRATAAPAPDGVVETSTAKYNRLHGNVRQRAIFELVLRQFAFVSSGTGEFSVLDGKNDEPEYWTQSTTCFRPIKPGVWLSSKHLVDGYKRKMDQLNIPSFLIKLDEVLEIQQAALWQSMGLVDSEVDLAMNVLLELNNRFHSVKPVDEILDTDVEQAIFEWSDKK